MTMEDFRQKAKAVFHQPPHSYNCAQAVAQIAGRDDLITQLKAFGGGRAPEGVCGALHAAILVSPEKETESIKAGFLNQAGDLTCKEIKGKAKTSCPECVAIGAMLADKHRE